MDILITLNQIVTNEEIIQHLFEAFEKNMDLKDTIYDWDKLRPQNKNWITRGNPSVKKSNATKLTHPR